MLQPLPLVLMDVEEDQETLLKSCAGCRRRGELSGGELRDEERRGSLSLRPNALNTRIPSSESAENDWSKADIQPLAVPPRQQQPTVSLSQILAFQWQDPESREANSKVAIALAVFGGAVVLFSQLGDLLVPAL